MAKKVAVIDIGSNSVRMAVYGKTSRFAFHLLYEAKSKVRLSENAYTHNGNLQEDAMQRTFFALQDFLSIIESFKVRKTLCVATSALRDAPNKKEFLVRIQKELQLNIKIISEEREAYLGAMSCVNLLPHQDNALSIDIGGGSTEFSYIKNNTIKDSFSLQLGTIRLKELYFDTNDIQGAIEYIDDKLSVLDSYSHETLIGIGGTFRSLSTSLMKLHNYPLNKLHGYECSSEKFNALIENILSADENTLKELSIKRNRFDIIKPGALILQRVFNKLSIKNTIASGVGVREGVYLSDLLRNSKDSFPHNYNCSVRYLLDSNIHNSSYANHLSLTSKRLFDLTHEAFGIDRTYRNALSIASKLYPAGRSAHFFSQNRHSYYLIKSALEYGFSHSQIMLIATLTRYAKNKLPSQKHLDKYKELLPDSTTIHYLTFLISISIALLSHKPRNIDFTLSYKDGCVQVDSESSLYLSKEACAKVSGIEGLELAF